MIGNMDRDLLKETEDGEIMINVVQTKSWKKVGRTEVTIDSASDESVCPLDRGSMFQLEWVRAGEEMKLRNANGGKIEHYGERNVFFKVAGKEADEIMGMGFQAIEVRKPLAAVHRIVEQGNRVQFGPQEVDNFIVNVKIGKRGYLRKKGRSYVLDADFMEKERTALHPGEKSEASTRASFQRQP